MRPSLPFFVFSAAILLGALAAAPARAQNGARTEDGSAPLEALQLSLAPEVTVSGLSSGAFMTVQLQTAFSAAITGVGVVSGGPFACAEGYVPNPFFTTRDQRIAQAVAVCLNPTETLPYVHLLGFQADFMKGQSLATIRLMERQDRIDPAAGIADDRIYMFLGTEDPIVRTETMGVLRDIYRELGVPDAAVDFVEDLPAGHSFVTAQGDVECARTMPDYLNLCDADGAPGGPAYDQAEAILTHLLGPLAAPTPAAPGHLLTFDQSLYAAGAVGMDPEAFVYVPQSCRDGAECRLHVALHGCTQGRSASLPGGGTMGDRYATLTGYNSWAEANGIVVLYPQAIAVPAPLFKPFWNNPKGCWDWWGYGGDDYLGREAPQIAAIARMTAALGAPLSR